MPRRGDRHPEPFEHAAAPEPHRRTQGDPHRGRCISRPGAGTRIDTYGSASAPPDGDGRPDVAAETRHGGTGRAPGSGRRDEARPAPRGTAVRSGAAGPASGRGIRRRYESRPGAPPLPMGRPASGPGLLDRREPPPPSDPDAVAPMRGRAASYGGTPWRHTTPPRTRGASPHSVTTPPLPWTPSRRRAILGTPGQSPLTEGGGTRPLPQMVPLTLACGTTMMP